MTKLIIASVIIALATAPTNAHAAIVTFSGQFDAGTGSTLGTAPPSLPFSISLDFSESAPGLANVNNGTLTSSGATILITGGLISLTDNAANDSATFALDTVGPTGTISTSFSADAVTDNQVNTPNLVSIINASAPSTIVASFVGGGTYTGSVTSAVPEPNAALIVLGVSLIFLRRSR